MARSLPLFLAVAAVVAVPMPTNADSIAASIDGALSLGVPSRFLVVDAVLLPDGAANGFLHDGTIPYAVVEVVPPNAFLPYWCLHGVSADPTNGGSILVTILDTGDGVTTLDTVASFPSGWDMPCAFAWELWPTTPAAAGDMRGAVN